MLLWYDVNSVGTANRSFSFNLGPVDINLNRMNAPDSLARQDVWQLITVVVNGSQHSLYLNDEEVVRTDFAGTDQATIEGNSLRIGSWNTSSNQYFSGILDEVRIYDSVLSNNDVSVLYGNGIGDLGVIPRISVDANHSAPIISEELIFISLDNRFQLQVLIRMIFQLMVVQYPVFHQMVMVTYFLLPQIVNPPVLPSHYKMVLVSLGN